MKHIITTLFFAFCISLNAQTKIEIQEEISILQNDSIALTQQIETAVQDLAIVVDRLSFFREELSKAGPVAPNDDILKVTISLPKDLPIAQPSSYLQGNESEKLKPTIVFIFSERAGVTSLYYTASSDRDYKFELEKGALQYGSGVDRQSEYTPKEYLGNFASTSYSSGETIDIEILPSKHSALNKNMSMYCVAFVYLDENRENPKTVFKWVAAQKNSEDWFTMLAQGDRKTRLPYYTRYITSVSSAKKYLRALERRGLDNKEVRGFYKL